MELGLQSDEEPPPAKGVGGTLFTQARNLESLLGFGNIFLKLLIKYKYSLQFSFVLKC